jgi:uncharacterized protein YdhG (YjbR/CyaY superfamily)
MPGSPRRKGALSVLVSDHRITSYLIQLPREHRTRLEQLRATIPTAVQDVEEVVGRGVPAFRYRGRPLVSIGAARHHVSLFVMNGRVLDAHAADLEAYDSSNTVVRFDPSRPIPVDLVTKLVKARAAEIEGTTAGRVRRSPFDSVPTR